MSHFVGLSYFSKRKADAGWRAKRVWHTINRWTRALTRPKPTVNEATGEPIYQNTQPQEKWKYKPPRTRAALITFPTHTLLTLSVPGLGSYSVRNPCVLTEMPSVLNVLDDSSTVLTWRTLLLIAYPSSKAVCCRGFLKKYHTAEFYLLWPFSPLTNKLFHF